jgi:hypothetical protein
MPKEQLQWWQPRRTDALLHLASTNHGDPCVERRMMPSTTYMTLCCFLIEGVFFPTATAGGFMWGRMERQPRNDECFQPTADLF